MICLCSAFGSSITLLQDVFEFLVHHNCIHGMSELYAVDHLGKE